MAVKTTRTRETARAAIDHSRCRACGLCARVCGMTLYMEDGRVRIDENRLFGCVGCAQCAMVCPEGCITVAGRTMAPEDVVPLPPAEAKPPYESLQALYAWRRSVRLYRDEEVEADKVAKIIAAAAAAPMGLPPSDVSVLVLGSRAKVREFAFDFIDGVAAKQWLFSAPVLALLRPFIGREGAEMMHDFVRPFVGAAIAGRKQDNDLVLYGAPLAMLFQASPYSDPADPYIAATYAMLAGEALGLGTCMIGSVAPLLPYLPALREKFAVSPDIKGGLIVLFGYPAVGYRRGVRRTLASITYA